MTDEQKEWIDKASYEELLWHWRFAPISDPIFHGEIMDYYQKVMLEKKSRCDHVAASKRVGWEKP